MSKTSETPETPKPSKFVQKLNSMKPSALSDEKKATVVGRIKIIGAFTAGATAMLAAVATASYYSALKNEAEKAEEILRESYETTED